MDDQNYKINRLMDKHDLKKLILWFIIIIGSFISAIYVNSIIKQTSLISFFALFNILIFVTYVLFFRIINISSVIRGIKLIIRKG